MYCSKCGNESADGVQFCGQCGNSLLSLSQSAQASPYATPASFMGAGASTRSRTQPSEPMTFGRSLKTCFSKYADFNGRASRAEYWYFYLFTLLLSLFAERILHSNALYGLVTLGTLLPSLAAAVRRLHDTNRSGWWWMISLTIIGIIPLIIWLASSGDSGDNEYGESPL